MNTNPSNNEISEKDTISDAQKDMYLSYANGSVGIIISGLVWLVGAIISFQYSAKQGVWALLIGGMFIHPLSVLLAKILGISGKHKKGNPFGNLAMEGTIMMIMCLPLAFILSLQRTEWFFQAMLMIIGGRYLTFASIYGSKIYWILGGVLAFAAYLLFRFDVQSFESAITGSLIEITFGIFMFIMFRKQNIVD